VSKQIVEGATIDSLCIEAISVAREEYKRRMNRPHIIEETDAMSDMDLLVKHKLIINNKVTNAAMILLGKSDYDYLLNSPP